MLEKLFKDPRVLRVADKVIRNEVALILGVCLFYFIRREGWWDWLEPFLTIVVLPTGLATWYQSWRARQARYAPPSVYGDSNAIVVVEVVGDCAASVDAHFGGRKPDVFIRAREEFGGKVYLEPEDMTALVKKAYSACLPFRNRTICLVVAAPAGACFQLGQLLAAHKFDIVVLSWARDKYQVLPRLGIDDIGGV